MRASQEDVAFEPYGQDGGAGEASDGRTVRARATDREGQNFLGNSEASDALCTRHPRTQSEVKTKVPRRLGPW